MSRRASIGSRRGIDPRTRGRRRCTATPSTFVASLAFPEYILTLDVPSSAEVPSDQTVTLEDVTDSTAATLEAAFNNHPLVTDCRPPGVDPVLGDDVYVRIDGNDYDPELQSVDHDAVPVSIELTDVDEDAHAFTLGVEADDESATIVGGPPAPFEVLDARGWFDSANGGHLWSDVYDTSGHVSVEYEDGEPIIWTHSLLVRTSLEPGDEPVTETYEVRRDWGVDAGYYRITSSLSISWDGGESEYPYVVRLAVPPLE